MVEVETYVEALQAAGLAAGLDRVGVASAEPFDVARRAIEERKAEGLNGGMQFTYRNPGRSTDPSRSLDGARSLVVGARSYPAQVPKRQGRGPLARVARYATADHYAQLRQGLDAIAELLRADGWAARVLVDDNALVDRAAAHRAALGWYGKSANLIVPGAGTWFVLGSVLTDAELSSSPEPVPDGCGACTRCVDSCPTGAIVAPGVVDARRCLAWLVQAEGDFPEEHRAALGDRIYGCDVCQEVCPPNRRATDRAGEVDPRGTWVEALELLELDDDELLARHGRWYIPRRDPRYLRRNALVVLGNVGDGADPAVVSALGRYLGGTDPMLKDHAAWAAQRLGVVVAA